MSKAKGKGSDDEEGGKGKGGFLKMVIFAVVLLTLGAGGAYGAFAAGLFGGAEVVEDNTPKLIAKGAEDPFAPVGGKGDEQTAIVHGDGGSEYRIAYFSFEEPFTSNLAGSAAMIQVDIAASTQRDGRVLQWLGQHELAIRSALLTELANTPEADIYTSDGKKRLQTRLTAGINAVLTENEGFGGVDNVHFKAFLVQ